MQPAVNYFPITLLFLLGLDFGHVSCLLHKERPLDELETFVNDTRVFVSNEPKMDRIEMARHLHHGRTDDKHRLPFRPVQRQDGEESLQEWRVEQSEVQRH